MLDVLGLQVERSQGEFYLGSLQGCFATNFGVGVPFTLPLNEGFTTETLRGFAGAKRGSGYIIQSSVASFKAGSISNLIPGQPIWLTNIVKWNIDVTEQQGHWFIKMDVN